MLVGHGADGTAYDVKQSQRGRFVLVSYWGLKDKEHPQDVLAFEKIFRKYQTRSDLLMVSFWTDYIEEFLDEMRKKGRGFYNQPRWWTLCHIYADKWLSDPSHNKRGRDWIRESDIEAGKTPIYFLLDKKFKFLAIDIPQAELEKTIESFLNTKKPKTPCEASTFIKEQ